MNLPYSPFIPSKPTPQGCSSLKAELLPQQCVTKSSKGTGAQSLQIQKIVRTQKCIASSQDLSFQSTAKKAMNSEALYLEAVYFPISLLEHPNYIQYGIAMHRFQS